MRKLFWTCMLCGVMLAGGVISTAHFAVHHPDSLVGRVLHGASHVAGVINPVIGFTPLGSQDHSTVALAEEQSADAGDNEPWQIDPVAVPDDPIPVADELNGKVPEPGPIVVTSGSAAPIVISEEGNTGNPVPEYAPADPQLPIPIGRTRLENEEFLPAASVAPQLMPYCNEEDVYEILPMPSPVEDTQVLPMPHPVKEDDKSASTDKEPTHCTDKPACGSKAPYGNIFRAFYRMHDRSGDKSGRERPEIDTMEFRPSDLHLYDFGPSSL